MGYTITISDGVNSRTFVLADLLNGLNEDKSTDIFDWCRNEIDRVDMLGLQVAHFGAWSLNADYLHFHYIEGNITANELEKLTRAIQAKNAYGISTIHFEDESLRAWSVWFDLHLVTLDTHLQRLLAATVLAVWEKTDLDVMKDGRMVLGDEPDYCPIYSWAKKLLEIVNQPDDENNDDEDDDE